MVNIGQAESEAQIEQVRELLREYGATPDFGNCFKGFEEEVRALPGKYAPPAGRLLLASVDGAAAGCIGLWPMEPGYCEVRRLYVRPQFRGQNLGRTLAEAILVHARAAGYHTARLGTLPVMKEAISLYQGLGFNPVKPYKPTALAGAIYMEMALE